jgi:hypothetical protein
VGVSPDFLAIFGLHSSLTTSHSHTKGPLSFLADYCNMTSDSIFHVLDRAVAVPALVLEVVKLAAMFYHREQRWILTLYSLSLALAMYSYTQSQVTQANVDRDGFVLWHSLWHIYPIMVCAILAFDRHLLSFYAIHCGRKSLKSA